MRPPPDHLLAAAVVALAAFLGACAGDDSAVSTDSSVNPTTAEPSAGPAGPTTDVDVEATASDFGNLNDMTPVRGFFVDNLLGDLRATVAVAESPDGGVYPVGSLVQLFPGEAMVKRAPGFSPGLGDWEFFELDVSEAGTEIRVRGGAEVINRFGGSCADCHARAEPQWDFICEQDHGCDPLPIERSAIEALQASDPRPRAEG